MNLYKYSDSCREHIKISFTLCLDVYFLNPAARSRIELHNAVIPVILNILVRDAVAEN